MVEYFTVYETNPGTVLLQGGSGDLVLCPTHDKPLLRHMAGLEINDNWSVRWQPDAAVTMRYWFDCWPQPWMGLTVAEELAFGQAWSEEEVRAVLSRWQLAGVALDAAILGLTRFDAIRLMLARAELGGCDVLLMEQPDAGLSDVELQSLTAMIRLWLQRSATMVVVTTNRESAMAIPA